MNPSGIRSIAAALCMASGLCASGHASAAQSGSGLVDPQHLAHASGQVVYRHVCQACHMPDGRGATGAGRFPSLAENPKLVSADYMIAVVLMGRSNMPSFRPRPDLSGFAAMTHVTLTDTEIARVANYVRTHFGNHYADLVTPAQVAAMHPAKEASP